MKNRNWL